MSIFQWRLDGFSQKYINSEKLGSHTGSKWWPSDLDVKDDPLTRLPNGPASCLMPHSALSVNGLTQLISFDTNDKGATIFPQDRQTDGRTPYRYTDAQRSRRAVRWNASAAWWCGWQMSEGDDLQDVVKYLELEQQFSTKKSSICAWSLYAVAARLYYTVGLTVASVQS